MTQLYDSGSAGGTEERPLRELVATLSRDGSLLVQQEIALAKKEIGEKLSKAKTDAAAIAIGALVLYAGVLILLMAVVLLLAQVMPTWLSAMLVGAAVTIVGAIMAQRGKKNLEETSLKPEKAIDSAQRDVEMMKEAIR